MTIDDLRRCLEAHGFERRDSNNPHPFYRHPNGVVVNLPHTHGVRPKLYLFMKSVRDAILRVKEDNRRAFQQEIGMDAAPELPASDASHYVVVHLEDYPECAGAMKNTEFNSARGEGLFKWLQSDLPHYVARLRELETTYGIERVVDDEERVHLKINGSGVSMPVPMLTHAPEIYASNDAWMRARYQALDMAEEKAKVHLAECHNVPVVMHDLLVKLKELGAELRKVEAGWEARLPALLAKRAGKIAIGLPDDASPVLAKKLVRLVADLDRERDCNIRRQNAMLNDLEQLACGIQVEKDCFYVTTPSGYKHSFARDASGCADVAEIRMFAHRMFPETWRNALSRMENMSGPAK